MCIPFFHKYKVVKAELGYDGDVKTPLTCVSYVCKRCGKSKSKMIEGHFTKEDLTISKERKNYVI